MPASSRGACNTQNDQFLTGLATDGLRIITQVKIAVDATTGAHAGHTYATWDQCAVNENYAGFLCGAANVAVDDIATPTSTGTRISYPGARYDDFMPTIAVDQTTGNVYLAYYSTKTDLNTLAATPSAGDVGNHSGIRPFETRSTGGTSLFAAPFGLTTANDDYQADPCVQSGCAPQFGDYFQIVANGGLSFVHFNVNFEQKGGPTFAWGANGLVNQEDNYLCRVLTFPPTDRSRPCS